MRGQHIHNRPDPHSYYREGQLRIKIITWGAKVDFGTRTLDCVAVLEFDATGVVDLDTRDLAITSVEACPDFAPIPFTLADPDPILGSRLSFTTPTRAVRIAYRTSPESAAIQWLTPEQTAGKQHPMVYSHAGAINARAIIPCQDTPLVRFRYHAELVVPRELHGLMAASRVDVASVVSNDFRSVTEHWEQNRPVPSYCFAFIVGDLVSQSIGTRCAVFAESRVVDAAADEFRDLPRMLEEAEKIFGAYPWPRCDVLVMPPAFPCGGMEQPERAVVSPTIITGDRSLVSVVAHELAHGWFGNCVTATWEHLWLVEGFACYAEQRILEAVYGRDFAELRASLRYREMERDIAELMPTHPALTRLRMDLAGMDPEVGATQVPYMKGYLLLRAIEEYDDHLGVDTRRAVFDEILRSIIAQYRWSYITSEVFLREMSVHFDRAILGTRAWEWIYEAGLPHDAPKPHSDALQYINGIASVGCPPSASDAKVWRALEWSVYLNTIPRDAHALCEQLNAEHHLETHRAAEVRWAWYLLALESGAAYDRDALAAFLASVGRLRYLTPIYRLLTRNPATAAWAREVYDRCTPGYHPTARREIERVFAEASASS